MRESTETLVLAAIAVAAVGTASPAASNAESDRELSGTIASIESRWGYSGETIVTESTLVTDDGTSVTLHQLGGVVGDVAMVVTHSPPLLEAGARVRVVADPVVAPSGRLLHRLATVIDGSAFPPTALPFVQSTNEKNVGLFWQSGCAAIGLETGGAITVPGDLEVTAIEDAIGEWRASLATCSYLDLQFVGKLDVQPKFDGVSVIRFREQRWSRPASGDDPEVIHDPAAAALTFLTFGIAGDRNGAILDADIEMNGVDFKITVDGVGDGPAACEADLVNTLTHELGHFLGLDHTCWDGIGTSRPVDDQGEPVPLCQSQLSTEIREATMYAFQECSETKKRSLEADDTAAVCEIYASAKDPGTCVYPDVVEGGFCSATRRDGGGLLALFALALLLVRPRRSTAAASSR